MQGVQLSDIQKQTRPVTEKTVWHILNNPFYIGKITHKGELFDSTVRQPLVDLSTYYKVQAVLKTKAVKVYYPNMAFFTYRGLVKCGTCKRVYSPYVQKGVTYYRSACLNDCTNPLKHINDKFVTDGVQAILDRIHFTDIEIEQIEAHAFKGLDKLTEKRNKEIEDLTFQKNKVVENLKYLTDDKLNLLRTGVFTPAQLIEEEGRLTLLLSEIQGKISNLSISAKAMIEYVMSFSELVKNTALYFQYALDTEKRDIVVQVFSELYIENGELKYVANEAYNALLQRFDANFMATCGEGEIRTPGRISPTPHFEGGAFNHSATSPFLSIYLLSF